VLIFHFTNEVSIALRGSSVKSYTLLLGRACDAIRNILWHLVVLIRPFSKEMKLILHMFFVCHTVVSIPGGSQG
jgi:hypothetical protein